MAKSENPGPSVRGESPARVFERQVWELWVSGATVAQIGETLGKAQSTVGAALDRARAYRAAIEDGDQIRQQRIARLMGQIVDLQRRLARPHPLLDRSGAVVYVEVPAPTEANPDAVRRVPAEDDAVAVQIHNAIRQLDVQLGKVTGTDAATRWEIMPGRDGGVEVRESKVVSLKERAAQVRLLPRPEAIDVSSSEPKEA